MGSRIVTTGLLLVFLIYSLLPLFYLIVSATKDGSALFSSFGLWFSSFDLFANLGGVFTYDGGVFVNWLWNTAYYSVVSAVGASFVATIAGYSFAKFRFRGRTLLFAVILGSIMVPPTALVIPTYLLLSKVELINTPLAVILPSLISPFGVYLMRVYAEQSVPDDLLDAARVDGAGELRIFWSVALRVLAPGFVTVLLLSFVTTWNNYFLPLVVLNDPSLYPLTVGLASWNSLASGGGGAQNLYPLVITGALVSIIPIILSLSLCLLFGYSFRMTPKGAEDGFRFSAVRWLGRNRPSAPFE
ncbi:MAG: carbohydrate ABC transporter permease, partial [Actinomycetota bacterium]|nr:carbohydrate ABC transporter permease [Actinomycetota bacterium]